MCEGRLSSACWSNNNYSASYNSSSYNSANNWPNRYSDSDYDSSNYDEDSRHCAGTTSTAGSHRHNHRPRPDAIGQFDIGILAFGAAGTRVCASVSAVHLRHHREGWHGCAGEWS